MPIYVSLPVPVGWWPYAFPPSLMCAHTHTHTHPGAACWGQAVEVILWHGKMIVFLFFR